MGRLHKNIITDENGRPVAVQIDYADWLALEPKLAEVQASVARKTNLAKHAGVLAAGLDPLEYQNAIRSEWG